MCRGLVLQGHLLGEFACVKIVVLHTDWRPEVLALMCGRTDLRHHLRAPVPQPVRRQWQLKLRQPGHRHQQLVLTLCPVHGSLGCLIPGQQRQQLVLLAQHQ